MIEGPPKKTDEDVAKAAEDQRIADGFSQRGFAANIKTSGLGDEEEVKVKRVTLGV